MITVSNLSKMPVAQPTPEPTPRIAVASLDTILLDQKLIAIGLGATAEIHGAWVWATFNGKPNETVRAELKANKWVWCRNHGKWAFRGKPCHSKKSMTWDYIANKYPEEEN